MKYILFTVLAFYAMIVEPHPYLGVDGAAGIGQGLGNAIANTLSLGLGAVANIGAGALGLGAGVINAVASGVQNGLGILGSTQGASGNVQQGSAQGETQNDSEEAEAYSKESHKRSEKDHHDHVRHRSIFTTITRVENSDSHDVDSHQAVEESAQDAGAFKKQASAASQSNSSNYDGNSQEEEEN